MERQTPATAPPFIVAVLFVGLTFPSALANDPVTPSIDGANLSAEQHPAAAPSSDINDLSKSQHGNIVINQNLQQPDEDGIPGNSFQHQEGSQHVPQSKNMPPETYEEAAVIDNSFDTGNVEAKNSQRFVSGEGISAELSASEGIGQNNNHTLSTYNKNEVFSIADEATSMTPLDPTTIQEDLESSENTSTSIKTFLDRRHLPPGDNMPFITHLDGEVSAEQQNENMHSEEMDVTQQPESSTITSKLWYLEGTQHENVNDNRQNSNPIVHEDEKLDNELIAALDSPLLQPYDPTEASIATLSANKTTANIDSVLQPQQQPDNDLFSDKVETHDINANLLNANTSRTHVNNEYPISELLSTANNSAAYSVHRVITTEDNTTFFADSTQTTRINLSSLNKPQNTDNHTKASVYYFTITVRDKEPVRMNHSISPTPTLTTMPNIPIRNYTKDYHSANYYDNVLVSSPGERVFENHPQPEVVQEIAHNGHSDVVVVENPHFPVRYGDNMTQTENTTSLVNKIDSTYNNSASTVLEPSFRQSASHSVAIETSISSSTTKANSSGDQSEALLSIIKIIANHANTKYQLGNDLFASHIGPVTHVHTKLGHEVAQHTDDHVRSSVLDYQKASLNNHTNLSSPTPLLTSAPTAAATELLTVTSETVTGFYCPSEITTCIPTSTPQEHKESTVNNMSPRPFTITVFDIPTMKPSSVNEIDRHNPVPLQPIKPTKTRPSHEERSIDVTLHIKNTTHEQNDSAKAKRITPPPKQHPPLSSNKPSNTSFVLDFSATPTSSNLLESTTVVLSPPAVYILLIFNAPWITVCLHDKELKSTLAEELTNLLNSAIHPQQIIVLTIGSKGSTSWALLNTQADVCQDIEHGQTSPSFLVIYVVDDSGEADQSLTTALGNGLLHEEIKFSGTAFQNMVLEVRIYPTSTSSLAHNVAETNYFGLVAAFTISGIAGTSLVLLCILLLVLRHRHMKYRHHQQCRPVTDNYSLDSISIYSSFRRKRNSKRKFSYLNMGFNDSSVPSHQVNFAGLANVCLDQDTTLEEEFLLIPMKSCKLSDLPSGAEDKNRYANIIPIPETRVHLSLKSGEQNSEYINANYVQFLQGHKGQGKKYIACQAPMENTVADFWRMVWEQQSKVIVMLTQFEEDNVPKCAQYFPESEVSCHMVCGDYQVTLKSKEVLQNYTISMLQVRDLERNLLRDVIHFWYTAWPSHGVPCEKWSVIAMLLEVRPHMFKNIGPAIVHCSTGTGRTGTIIAIDICMREFEDTRMVDIPRCVSYIRKQRGGAVQNKEQYCFIYQVLNEYAIRLINPSLRSSFRSDTSTIKR